MGLWQWAAVLVVLAIGAVKLVWWSDRRWYEAHPGAEEKIAKMHEEQDKIEGRS